MSNGTITMTGAEYDALAGKIAALEAELAKLKGEYEWVTSINTALDESNQRAWGELAKLRAGQEPVEWRCRVAGSDHYAHFPTKRCRFCEPLYTAPQPSAVLAGFVLVPVEPTPEMVSAAEEAHMPFGDMDIALRMAMLAAPAPVQAEPATYKAMLSAATSAANATEFSQFLSAVMDAAGLVRHGRRSKELSEYLGRMCMQYRLSAVGKEPVHAEPASPWVAVTERLPQIKQVLSEKCTLEGRDIPTLYRSGEVLTFDGKRVSAGIVEWFHAKSPLSGVTHWMPLPKSPESSK